MLGSKSASICTAITAGLIACSSSAPSQRPDAEVFDAEVSDAEVLDAGPTDAVGPELGMTDDGAIEAPVLDITIGPYPSALEILDRGIAARADQLDARVTYAQAPAQGQLLHAIVERLMLLPEHRTDERDRLIDLAIRELGELMGAADRVIGGGPAFGLDRAWDAFSDGSENPAFTPYAWQSGLIMVGIAHLYAYLSDLGDPSREASLAEIGASLQSMLDLWHDHYTELTEDGETLGFFWYSTEPSDAIAVYNTSAVIAMASQIYAETTGDLRYASRPRAFARLFAKRKYRDAQGSLMWNYADDLYPGPTRVEDVEHSELSLHFAHFAIERGWWTQQDREEIADTLADRVWTGHPARPAGRLDGSSLGDLDWGQARFVPTTMALFARDSGRPELFEYARSILVSSYLSYFYRDLDGTSVDEPRAIALARLIRLRPTALSSDSRWSIEVGSSSVSEGLRLDASWGEPERFADEAGFALAARSATPSRIDILWPDLPGPMVVSLTHWMSSDGVITAEPSGETFTIAATRGEDGSLRWMRTSIVSRSGDRALVLPAGLRLHLVEVTPLP